MKHRPITYAVLAVAAAIGLIAGFFYAIKPASKPAPGQMRQMKSMPAELDLSTEKPSDGKAFAVSVESNLDPVTLNKIHSWTVEVKTPGGKPVEDARITVQGGMPMHQHGLPTAPRVTKNLGQGRYLVEGMKFSMSGWWELIVRIEAGASKDSATFNLILK